MFLLMTFFGCESVKVYLPVSAHEKWLGLESNQRRRPFQGRALPTELPSHTRSRAEYFIQFSQSVKLICGSSKKGWGLFLRPTLEPELSSFFDARKRKPFPHRPGVLISFEVARQIPFLKFEFLFHRGKVVNPSSHSHISFTSQRCDDHLLRLLRI